jgi:hypothetical protein
LEIIGFPKAQLILEAQAHLLKVLSGVVERLTEGSLPESSLGNWTRIAERGFKQAGACKFASSFVNQPFSPPPTFDVEKLLKIATTRRDVAGDHVELLQTDPSYLRHHVELIVEYHICKICGDVDHHEVTALEIVNDVHIFWGWQWILEEIEIVKYNDSLVDMMRGQSLPSTLNDALGSLYAMLTYMIDRRSPHIQAVLPQRPGFSSNWTSGRDSFPGRVKLQRNDGLNMAQRFMKDPLDWCLTQLLGEPDGRVLYEREMLFAFLDFYLAGAPWEQKLRLDELLFNKYMDFSSLHEMRLMNHLCRPRFKERKIAEVQKREASRGWKYVNREFLEKSTAYHQLGIQIQASSLGILLKAVFSIAHLMERRTNNSSYKMTRYEPASTLSSVNSDKYIERL